MTFVSEFAAWTLAEDNRLVAARTLGLSFGVIAREYMPQRTEHSLKRRYDRLSTPGAPTWRPDATYERPAGESYGVAVGEAVVGSDKLLAATQAYYEREAKRRRVSIAHVILCSQQGPEAAALWEARAA